MEIPKCCDGCLKWEKFGKECWVYWELKKECTQKVESLEEMQFPLQ